MGKKERLKMHCIPQPMINATFRKLPFLSLYDVEYDEYIMSTAPVIWCIKDGKIARVELLIPCSRTLTKHERKLWNKLNTAMANNSIPAMFHDAFEKED